MHHRFVISLWGIISCLWLSASPREVVVPELFFTQQREKDNVDSSAVWHGPKGESWLISTAKGTHRLLVDNAVNGYRVDWYGKAGKALGEFNRPNGISVVDDLLFVVERDNRRVQVIALPEFKPLFAFGEERLKYPYGLFVQHKADQAGTYTIYITDDYGLPNDEIPPLSQLGARVQCFEVTVSETEAVRPKARWMKSFGATEGEGVLRVVESIYGDVAYDRLLIAEEDESDDGRVVKVYDFEGNFSGKTMGKGLFHSQVEGITLVQTGERSGYWVITDQHPEKSRFLVFDRGTLAYVGAFSGERIRNTDGVWFERKSLGAAAPRGVFYAVNDDQGVAAISWLEVEKSLKLTDEGLEQ